MVEKNVNATDISSDDDVRTLPQVRNNIANYKNITQTRNNILWHLILFTRIH